MTVTVVLPSAWHLQPPPFESSVQPVRTMANASNADPSSNAKSFFLIEVSFVEGGAVRLFRGQPRLRLAVTVIHDPIPHMDITICTPTGGYITVSTPETVATPLA